ncbi:MAG: metal-dependent hydrolase [Desulfobulbus sp.]|uniref:metal-dependent hydrolase n=1 Tax=Desulfobulbus sp. TaxID=895 RepID=UPI00284EC229|nr:metal-dependent hydrolase [Desulfobulbus sp.]MDR2550154.1 metal-dependent hydrolase [Desulfobulbus sp.]
MPTVITHMAVPLAVGLGLGRRIVPGPLLACGVVASMLPDLDVVGFKLGIAYAADLGHRGFSHSIVFALAIAALAAPILRRFRVPWSASFWFLLFAIVSHALLDACTTGGKGVALFWPFSGHRFFAPYQVIEVSPLSIARFMSGRGIAVLLSELYWVWMPSAALGALLFCGRRLMCRPSRSCCSPRT